MKDKKVQEKKERISAVAMLGLAEEWDEAGLTDEELKWLRGKSNDVKCIIGSAKRDDEEERACFKLQKTLDTPAVKRFVANENFKVGKITDGFEINSINHIFQKYLLDGVGIIDVDVPPMKFDIHEVGSQFLSDRRIIEILGGDKMVEIKLSQVWSIVTKHGLYIELQNCIHNSMYVRDIEGTLLNVIIVKTLGCNKKWDLNAYEVTSHNNKWGAWYVSQHVPKLKI